MWAQNYTQATEVSNKSYFRNNDYGNRSKYVSFSRRTIKAGECCSTWNRQGQQSIITGPHRVFLWQSHILFMSKHSANEHQYLAVVNRDGTSENLKGPCSMFLDPGVHSTISVQDAWKISASEAVVVHRNDDGTVNRYVVMGPAKFFPQANESIQDFSWHGSGEGKSKTEYVPNGWQFNKISVCPQQMYYNVKNVRCYDDAKITIKFMIFYEIKDVEQMLNATNDLTGEFITALSADVVSFTSKVTLMKFLENSSKLSELETYKTLVQRASAAGTTITQVVYRGYVANSQVKALHATSAQAAMQLQDQQRQHAQTEELQNLILKGKTARANQERQLKNDALTAKLNAEKELKDCEREVAAWKNDAASELLSKKNKAEHEFLMSLKKYGVNTTEFVCQKANPKPNQTILVGKNTPNVKVVLSPEQ